MLVELLNLQTHLQENPSQSDRAVWEKAGNPKTRRQHCTSNFLSNITLPVRTSDCGHGTLMSQAHGLES